MSDYSYYATTVKKVSRLTPNMIRIVLSGDDLCGFATTGKPDEFVYLLFPPSGAKTAVLPQRTRIGTGEWAYAEGTLPPPGRYYTIRRWNEFECELTIDFAVHEGGVGSAWAAEAKPGDPLGVRRPAARFNMPADCDWICLLSDFTGLPAVGRIIEEMLPGVSVMAHVEIPSHLDQQELSLRGDIALHWHESFCRDGQATRLDDIARSVTLPQGCGYIWIAGEAKAVSESRQHFRDILGFDKDRITSVGYWIEGQART